MQPTVGLAQGIEPVGERDGVVSVRADSVETLVPATFAIRTVIPRVGPTIRSRRAYTLRMGILVRDVRFQRPFHATMHLAGAGLRLGWTVYLSGVGDLSLDMEEEEIRAQAVRLREELSLSLLCHQLLEGALGQESIDLCSLDLLLLRFNPAAREPGLLSWGLWWPALFAAERAQSRGVTVVNAPQGLLAVLSKLHIWSLPARATVRGLVTRSEAEVRSFCDRHSGRCTIAKPLVGSGGSRVFLLDPGDQANRDQIIESLFDGAYALVQPFMQQARQGDKRLLLLDGEPLVVGDRVAVYTRLGPEGRVRNNIHAGGSRHAARLDEQERENLGLIAPWLRRQGLRLAGVDLLGGRILEVNGFCPGGIENINALYGLDLGPVILERLIRRGMP